ncbi:MAG: hypothetical protein ACTSUU_03390 [Candidatus Thorarchaeota archaeon]
MPEELERVKRLIVANRSRHGSVYITERKEGQRVETLVAFDQVNLNSTSTGVFINNLKNPKVVIATPSGAAVGSLRWAIDTAAGGQTPSGTYIKFTHDSVSNVKCSVVAIGEQ